MWRTEVRIFALYVRASQFSALSKDQLLDKFKSDGEIGQPEPSKDQRNVLGKSPELEQ